MPFEKCIADIEKAAGRPLEDAEREALADQMDSILRAAKTDVIEDLEKDVLRQVDSLAEDMRMAAVIEKRNAALNQRAQLQFYDSVNSIWSDEPNNGLLAFLGGITRARQGARDSVASAQAALTNHYLTSMIADLEREGVHSTLTNGNLDREIWRAMHELSEPEPSKARLAGLPDEAIKIAEVLNRYNEVARVDANLAGAWIKKLPGRVIKQTHDMIRIRRAGFDEWKNFIMERLDWDRTMPGVKDKEQALRDLYTQFASGEHIRFKEGAETGFKGFANIGKKMSHERVLHFKDADASFEYNHRFGSGTLAEGMLYGLERMAQDTALMRRMGPNAEMNLDAVIDRIAADLRRKGDPEKLSKFQKEARKIKKTLWPNLTGEARVPGSAMGAQISSGVRAWQQMSKLGSAVLSGIADISFYGSEVRYQGGSMLAGMGEAIRGLTEGKTSVQKKELLGMLGVLHDGMRATVAARFDASDHMPGRVAKTTQLFFKLSGLRWWTDRLRAKMALSMSHRLAIHKNKAWAELPDELTNVLKQFSLDGDKWDLLRAGATREADGRDYMTPEGLDELGDDVFAAYLAKRNIKATPARVRDLRIEIKDQFRSYFHDRSTTAVLEPDARTRGMLLRGTRPGTVEGEFLRHVALFKSFTASVIQKPLAREVWGRSAEGGNALKRIIKNGNGEMVGLAQLIAWNTAFGYLAMSTKDLVKGREPRNPNDARTWMAAMAQGGSLGIYGDFLFGDMKNRFGGTASSTLLGPTAGSFDDIVDLFQRFRDGDDTAAQAFRFATNNTPFLNMFYTKWVMDYLIVNRISEMMNPGYLRRMEKRVRKQNEQEFFLPPSEAIPYGG